MNIAKFIKCIFLLCWSVIVVIDQVNAQDVQSIRKKCTEYGLKEKTLEHENCVKQMLQSMGILPPKPPTQIKPAPTSPPLPPVNSEALLEEKFWEDAKNIGNKEAFEFFLEQFPRGRFSGLAKANIERLIVDAKEKQRQFEEVAKRQADEEVAKQARDRSRPGFSFKDCQDCPDMIVIPTGRFLIGASNTEEEREKIPEQLRGRSQPQRIINISSISVGRYEITVAQYRAFVFATNRTTPRGCTVWFSDKYGVDTSKDWRNPGFSQSDKHPVVCVSWEDASAYVQWLKLKTGKEYRLLSESEWEYAARAGVTASRYWGDDPNMSCVFSNGADLKAKAFIPGASDWTVANCDDGYWFTSPVGSFRPNGFGLFDMIGNASEWVQDCWADNYSSVPLDGSPVTNGTCSLRSLRGGAWFNAPEFSRSAYRSRNPMWNRYSFTGFRVAVTQ